MFETSILPELKGQVGSRTPIIIRTLHLFGVTESEVGEKIADRMARGRNPRVGTTVRKGTITIHILAEGETYNAAQNLASQEVEKIRSQFQRYVFGEDGLTLQEALGELLISRKITIATAESCTGGLVGKLLTDVPGISQVYRGGFVTYSNELKKSALGIPQTLLDKYGAVSPEVAQAMAEGARKIAHADLGIAVTGLAGPTGGSPEKPVGLVFHGTTYQGKTSVEKRLYPSGDRKRIRDFAARNALHLARLRVLKT